MNKFFRILLAASCSIGLTLAPVALWAQAADLGDFVDAPAGDSTVAIKVPATAYPVGGTARYFSPAGDNANDGLTPATAWRTLTNALLEDKTKTPTGATLVFAAGRYFTGTVYLNRAFTLQPAAGARAWFVGSQELPDARWERVGTTSVWRTKAAQPWTVHLAPQ